MVNVDFASPSLILGAVLIGCGVLLLQMRNLQTKVSRDADIVVAAMISIVGSTLIFQGWRLDPLLLLCQALTTSVAVWYGIETFRLRSKEEDLVDPTAPGMLPPPAGQQGFGMPPFQQPMGMGQQPGQQQGGYPMDPMAAPGASGYPPGAVPMAGAFLPPAREQAYPWGAPQPATIVQSGAEAEASGRWGAPSQPAQLPGPSGTGMLPMDPYAQPAYDPAMAMYTQQQAPMQADAEPPGYYAQQPAGDPYYAQQPPQQQTQGGWQQPQQPYMPADPQQQWYGAPDGQPAAAAPAGYGEQGYGAAAPVAGYPAPAAAPAATAAPQRPLPPRRPVSSEPIDDWE